MEILILLLSLIFFSTIEVKTNYKSNNRTYTVPPAKYKPPPAPPRRNNNCICYGPSPTYPRPKRPGENNER